MKIAEFGRQEMAREIAEEMWKEEVKKFNDISAEQVVDVSWHQDKTTEGEGVDVCDSVTIVFNPPVYFGPKGTI